MKTEKPEEFLPGRRRSVAGQSGKRSPMDSLPGSSLRSFDDWSTWFRGSDGAELNSSSTAPVAEVTLQSVRPAQCRQTPQPRIPGPKVRRGNSKRLPVTLRTSRPRLRSFDDWSNWFWSGGWPSVQSV